MRDITRPQGMIAQGNYIIGTKRIDILYDIRFCALKFLPIMVQWWLSVKV